MWSDFWQRLKGLFGDTTEQPEGVSTNEYYAFISYTNKDEYWAKTLQWRLEHYKIPTQIRKERQDLPTRVKPIFWYKNDLAGAHLSGSIKKELTHSKYLIVVCSPVSARSEWVNEEVKIFKEELGRGQQIIPFVVEGEMDAADEKQECLPRLLRNLPHDEQLRGIDVRKYGKSKAIVNLVSTLLDIRFDTLWDRFKHERRRKIAVGTTVAVLCAALLFGAWDYFLHTKYQYFADIEDCYGMPTGILPLKPNEASTRYRTYRFEYRQGLLQRVVCVDAKGRARNQFNTEYADRPAIQELMYINGDLSAIHYKDENNHSLYVVQPSTNREKERTGADLKDGDENLAANFIYSSTSVDQGFTSLLNMSYLDRILKTPSKIARYIYDRDEDGYIVRKMYGRNNGDDEEISMDMNGISGFEYERDSLHRVIRVWFLDRNEEKRANRVGVAGKRYQYDAMGNLIVAEYVDADGHLKYNELHWAKAEMEYDANGYPVEERFYDPNGQPCIAADGCHKAKCDFAIDHETFELFDLYDRPTSSLPVGANPGGFSGRISLLDENGRVCEVRYLDTEGRLCYNTQHVAIQKHNYDEQGRLIGIRYYGTDEQPCLNTLGYFYERYAYDEFDNQTECALYDKEEHACQPQLGYHRMRYTYDQTGKRLIDVCTEDAWGHPICTQILNGAARIQLGYRGSSRWVSEVLFMDPKNQPIEQPNMGSKVVCERDGYGQITTYKNYSYNHLRNEYRLSGNEWHSAIMRNTYNESGEILERSFYDQDEDPTEIRGIFQERFRYTSTGQLKEVSWYDADQQLCITPLGYSVCVWEYQNGAACSEAYYGTKREPVEVDGVHLYEKEIDDVGNVTSVWCKDKHLRPTIHRQTGAYKMHNLYDDQRRLSEVAYYNLTSDIPFVSIRMKTNGRGYPIEQVAVNAKGELVASNLNQGVAKMEYIYNDQDQLLYARATDANGALKNTTGGIAEIRGAYGKNRTEMRYTDEHQRLVNTPASPTGAWAYALQYHNDSGKLLFAKRLVDVAGVKIDTVREIYTYSSFGDLVEAVQQQTDMIHVVNMAEGRDELLTEDDEGYDAYKTKVEAYEKEIIEQYGAPELLPTADE